MATAVTLDEESFKRFAKMMKEEIKPVEEKVEAIHSRLDNIDSVMGVMKKEVSEIQDDLELLRKRMLAKTVIIHGIEEQPNEKYGDLDASLCLLPLCMPITEG